MAADLDIGFHFHHDAESVERITLVTRNISGHDCLLVASYPPNFVPTQQPGGPRIELCQHCTDRLPGGEEQEKLPLLLAAGTTAHQTFRYRTSSTGDVTGCVKAGWMSTIANDDMKHAILVVSKSLLKPICSAVDVVGYRPGPSDVTPLDSPSLAEERQLMLSAQRSTYYTDERFALRTDPQPAEEGAAPILLLQERSPEGDTRLDEVHSGMSRRFSYPHRQTVASDRGFAEIDSGARSRWSGLGEHRFQLFQVDDTGRTGEIHFLRSRPLNVLIADAATIPRTWGVTQQGVRVDLTLDKTQFRLGEDIVAHIAAQVVGAKEPVYGQPYLAGGAFFHTIARSFHFSIRDEDGPLENSDHRANLYAPGGGSSGPTTCTPSLEVGKVIPLDRSLRDYGLLPTRPGTYQLSVTWSPYHSRYSTCPSGLPDKPEQPFVTVTSNEVTITVVGDPPPTALPKFPEYTAWKKRFRLVDTAFGAQTALLDRATGLEWLRPVLTTDSNVPVSEEGLTARIAQEKEFAGWRFATRDEVRRFLAHFTGSADGSSQDPAIERKLLRLLGGTLEDTPDRQTGWIDSRITVRIAGLTPAPADLSASGSPLTCSSCGPGFWAHYAFIREGVKDGQITVTIDPDKQWKVMGKQVGGFTVFEGGSVHDAGFFLVRKR